MNEISTITTTQGWIIYSKSTSREMQSVYTVANQLQYPWNCFILSVHCGLQESLTLYKQ